MMKLILSLTLIWTLSSTAEALQCWKGGEDKPKELRSCEPTQRCATLAYQESLLESVHKTTTRLCVSSSFFKEGTHTYSFNVGDGPRFSSVHVCNTDGCNNQTITIPDLKEKNNLTCFGCLNDQGIFNSQCRNTAQCFGEMDRCINMTAKGTTGVTYYKFGCVTAKYCDVLSHVENLVPGGKFILPTKCCKGNFCNSAWSVKLNVMTLLFGLITLIFY